MQTKTLYILRHGETEQNRLGIVQGRGIDSILNDTGHWQSRAFFEKYKSVPFDKFYCSSQTRSYQTIHLFEESNKRILRDPRIDEINWGEHEGKAGDPHLMERYHRIIGSWSSGNYHDKADGGESAQDLVIRLQDFIVDIQKTSFHSALICTHGRTLRAMMCLFKNWPLSSMEQIKHQNTGLYQVVLHNGQWKVILENDCNHLIQNHVF